MAATPTTSMMLAAAAALLALAALVAPGCDAAAVLPGLYGPGAHTAEEAVACWSDVTSHVHAISNTLGLQPNGDDVYKVIDFCDGSFNGELNGAGVRQIRNADYEPATHWHGFGLRYAPPALQGSWADITALDMDTMAESYLGAQQQARFQDVYLRFTDGSDCFVGRKVRSKVAVHFPLDQCAAQMAALDVAEIRIVARGDFDPPAADSDEANMPTLFNIQEYYKVVTFAWFRLYGAPAAGVHVRFPDPATTSLLTAPMRHEVKDLLQPEDHPTRFNSGSTYTSGYWFWSGRGSIRESDTLVYAPPSASAPSLVPSVRYQQRFWSSIGSTRESVDAAANAPASVFDNIDQSSTPMSQVTNPEKHLQPNLRIDPSLALVTGGGCADGGCLKIDMPEARRRPGPNEGPYTPPCSTPPCATRWEMQDENEVWYAGALQFSLSTSALTSTDDLYAYVYRFAVGDFSVKFMLDQYPGSLTVDVKADFGRKYLIYASGTPLTPLLNKYDMKEMYDGSALDAPLVAAGGFVLVLNGTGELETIDVVAELREQLLDDLSASVYCNIGNTGIEDDRCGTPALYGISFFALSPIYIDNLAIGDQGAGVVEMHGYVGCMDPAAINYSPMATIAESSQCVYETTVTLRPSKLYQGSTELSSLKVGGRKRGRVHAQFVLPHCSDGSDAPMTVVSAGLQGVRRKWKHWDAIPPLDARNMRVFLTEGDSAVAGGAFGQLEPELADGGGGGAIGAFKNQHVTTIDVAAEVAAMYAGTTPEADACALSFVYDHRRHKRDWSVLRKVQRLKLTLRRSGTPF